MDDRKTHDHPHGEDAKDTTGNRLSVQRCRAMLGDAGAKLSDQEVTHLRDQMYMLAEMIFVSWCQVQELESYPFTAAEDPLE